MKRMYPSDWAKLAGKLSAKNEILRRENEELKRRVKFLEETNNDMGYEIGVLEDQIAMEVEGDGDTS